MGCYQTSRRTSRRLIRLLFTHTVSTLALIRSPSRRLSFCRILHSSLPRMPPTLTAFEPLVLRVKGERGGKCRRGTRAVSSTPISTKAPKVVTLSTRPVTSRPGCRLAMDMTEERNIGAKRSAWEKKGKTITVLRLSQDSCATSDRPSKGISLI